VGDSILHAALSIRLQLKPAPRLTYRMPTKILNSVILPTQASTIVTTTPVPPALILGTRRVTRSITRNILRDQDPEANNNSPPSSASSSVTLRDQDPEANNNSPPSSASSSIISTVILNSNMENCPPVAFQSHSWSLSITTPSGEHRPELSTTSGSNLNSNNDKVVVNFYIVSSLLMIFN
jgi:hypothetical protein